MGTSFLARLSLFAHALESSNTSVLTCEFVLFRFFNAIVHSVVFRRLDEADYDTVFTTLTHLPQDMSEEAVCSHITDIYLKISAQE